MPKSLKNLALLGFCVAAVSCVSVPTTGTSSLVGANAEIDRLAESYFEEMLPLNPLLATSIGDNRYNDKYVAGFSLQERQKAKALDEKYLALLGRIDRNALDNDHRITYDVMQTSL